MWRALPLSLVVAGSSASLLAGCADGCGARSSTPMATTAASAPPSSAAEDKASQRLTDMTLAQLAVARAASEQVQAGGARSAYLRMRRAVFAAAPYFRERALMGSEVLLGPLRSVDEGGGALALLDRGEADGDDALRARALVQVVRSIPLIEAEVRRQRVPPEAAAQAMSDAAFELGLMFASAHAGVPDGDDAVLADIRGTIAGLELGIAALAHDGDASTQAAAERARASLDQLDPSDEAAGLTGRAERVRTTGELGVALRALAAARGIAVRIPYRARYPLAQNGIAEPIHAFTLPAPRSDLRSGDADAMVALGRTLFFERALSPGAQRSCADCHRPDRGYADGLATPPSLDPHSAVTRNTPSLWYTSMNASQLWDGRFASAERQALRVLHSKAEMGLSEAELAAALAAHAEAFAAAFGGEAPSEALAARALVAFEIDALAPGQAPIDRYARGEAELRPALARGFDLFAGKGRCARCHVPPTFAGSRPRDFAVPVFAALGVPAAMPATQAAPAQLDPDPGRGAITKLPLDAHAFKTPGLRNVHASAPYFHNGSYPQLEDVLGFYNDGGVAGVALDNRDPDVRPLKLTDEEIALLLRWLREGLADPPEALAPP